MDSDLVRRWLVGIGLVAANGVVFFTRNVIFTNTGLQVYDTNSSNSLTLQWNENDTSDRTLSLLVNSANRSISLSGDLTVSSAATISGTNTGDQTAGAGLTGTTTLNVGAGTGITVNADDVAVNQAYAFAWTAAHTWSVAGLVATWTNTSDAASVQVAILQGDRATMADNDEAYLSLRLSDDAGTQTEVARVTWVATDVNVATSVDGRIDFAVMTAGSLAKEMQLDGTALSPSTSDGLALGTAALMWSDLFLASGSVINWNAGDLTLTHSSNTLTLAGGLLAVTDLLVGTGSVGTSGVNVVVLGSGTAPTSSPADEIQIYSADVSAGNAALHVRGEGTWAIVSVGGIIVRQSGGTAGTDEVEILHDGANVVFTNNNTIGGSSSAFYFYGSDDKPTRVYTGTLVAQASTTDIMYGLHSNSSLVFTITQLARMSAGTLTLAPQLGDSVNPVVLVSTQNAANSANLERFRVTGMADTAIVRVSNASLEFAQISDVPTPASNNAAIGAEDVAGTAEVIVSDEAGTETQISPHAMDGPAWLYDADDPMPRVVREIQRYTGVVRFTNESRKAALLERQFSGEDISKLTKQERTIVHVESLADWCARTGKTKPKRDWNVDQAAKQAWYDGERASQLDRLAAWRAEAAAWESLSDEEKNKPRPDQPEPAVWPAKNIRKPKPAWLAARGA